MYFYNYHVTDECWMCIKRFGVFSIEYFKNGPIVCKFLGGGGVVEKKEIHRSLKMNFTLFFFLTFHIQFLVSLFTPTAND